MSVLLVCVNYRSTAATLRYLRSLEGLRDDDGSLRVVVVDNSPPADRLELPDGLLGGRVQIVRSEANLGYFGGAALGLRLAVENGGVPEAVIVSNVDLTLEQPDFLAELRRAVQPGIAMLAPSIRSQLTGVEQNPYLLTRPTSARMRFYTWLYAWYPAATLHERAARAWKRLRRRWGPAPRPAGVRDIYAGHGSFIVLTREFLQRGGQVEYGAFLFSEEIHLAEQARAMGLRVRFHPGLQVCHDEHVSVGRYQSRQLVAHARDAARYCHDRYFRGG